MSIGVFKVSNLFDLEHTLAKYWLENVECPWDVVPNIGQIVMQIGRSLPADEYEQRYRSVWVHRSASVSGSACLVGPCVIGPRTEVRHCAFVRGGVLVGADCVVGNSTELKNCILFDGCQVPHFNYVGDSVLGFHSHFGAGAVTSNVRADRKPVVVHGGASFGDVSTGLSKLGAFVGDYAEVGCNSVLGPGTVIGRRSIVYPLSFVRGVVGEDFIFKNSGVVVEKRCDS